MSSDLANSPLVYGPGKKRVSYAYIVIMLVLLAVFFPMAWLPFSDLLEGGDAKDLLVSAGYLVFALVMVAIIISAIRKFLTKVVITVTDNGILIDTAGPFAKPPQELLWADIDRIDLLPMNSGSQHIRVYPARRTGGKRLSVMNHQLGVPLLDVVQGIADRADAAGYRLEGGPLTNPALFACKWRVVKL